MNGVINIYKEAGYSSFHAVYILRKITKEQKVGHTGTLDPDVTGVLPVCIGKATKLVGQLTDTDKIYRCRMLLGKATDTQDLSGNVLREMPKTELQKKLSKEAVTLAVRSFEGELQQIPPMYSALKMNGAKLVNLARRGLEVERKPRTITIYSITQISVSEDLQHAEFTVHCSRGTYIRTLCEDIGIHLGVPACMEWLERVQAAGLGLESAITLTQAELYASQGRLEEHLIPTDYFLRNHPPLYVTDDAIRKLIYGNYLLVEDVLTGEDPLDGSSLPLPFASKDPEDAKRSEEQIFRIYDRSGHFYALYRYDENARCYKCVKMFS